MDRIDEHDGQSSARRSDLSPDAYARITRRSRTRDATTGMTWTRARATTARRLGLRHAPGAAPITWTRQTIAVAVEASA